MTVKKKHPRIFMFSLDDRRLIAASHSRSPSQSFPKSNTKCRFCVRLIKRDLCLCLGVCVFCVCVCFFLTNIKPSGRPTGSWREQVSIAGFICRKGKDDVLSRFSGGPRAPRAQRARTVGIWCLQHTHGRLTHTHTPLHEEWNQVAFTCTAIN